MMLLHSRQTIPNDDGLYVPVIVRHGWYYDEKEKIRQDKEFAKLSGPVRTRHADKNEIEALIKARG